ncbi:MAG: GTPase HflX [Lachnospiraceae bacterium]|nr:GTPase HflX [Lachnospiraceae bacterium]
MAELIDTGDLSEKVILAGINTGDDEGFLISMKELKELTENTGAQVVGEMYWNHPAPANATYLGKGKIEELKALVEETGATGIVCDSELTTAQLSNLSNELDTKVMDRTLVILDIFARRATTSEGRVQVELAQMRYRMTRLKGLGTSLSRLGGGIGTRGPGEKKLETDRRLMRERITALKRELQEIERHRDTLRAQRQRNKVPVIAIVGYTNAGKSTLLNKLTNAGVLQEDMLFATLDPVTREYILEDGQKVLFTDTVGFIRNLPHNLVEAFKSTLEEVLYADIILTVADASDPDMASQLSVVRETLGSLGVKDKYVITAFNKCDKAPEGWTLKDFSADDSVSISAATGENLDLLLAKIRDGLSGRMILMERTFGYRDAGLIADIRKQGRLLTEEYRDDGIFVKAYVPGELFSRINKILK